jgi:LAO/AO transport system kinase
MGAEDPGWRRALSRQLTARARAPTREILDVPLSFGGTTCRVGITGPPGAGKSSLIALLAKEWLAASRRVGVLAIDPTSPLSGGALLGDRIRMDGVAQDVNLFIRSVSSGSHHDGLCPNIASLLDAFEAAAFDDLVLETVGVGQVSYAARTLVDTFVLVLVPESGDTVQTMKAGILELADIYVVNKADRETSLKLETELRAMAGWRGRQGAWEPPVILTSTPENRGAAQLVVAIESHRRTVLDTTRRRALSEARRELHLRAVLQQRIEEILEAHAETLRGVPTAEGLRWVIEALKKER